MYILDKKNSTCFYFLMYRKSGAQQNQYGADPHLSSPAQSRPISMSQVYKKVPHNGVTLGRS